MDIQKTFKEWLKEICRWGRDDWFLNWKNDTTKDKNYKYFGKVLIYTKDNVYSIRASKDREDDHTYLGCTVSKRKPRAGEDWNRGNDLADGKFNRETWERIKNDIIRYELVKVVHHSSHLPDQVKYTRSLGTAKNDND